MIVKKGRMSAQNKHQTSTKSRTQQGGHPHRQKQRESVRAYHSVVAGGLPYRIASTIMMRKLSCERMEAALGAVSEWGTDHRGEDVI